MCRYLIVACYVAVPLLVSCAASAAEAEIAPRIVASDNYGVIVKVPPGITYCPPPKDWVGSDHGVTLFLVPPTTCDSGSPSLPNIAVFYQHNVAPWKPEVDKPAVTAREAMLGQCGTNRVTLLRGLRLLGRQAVGCWKTVGGKVEVSIGALYDIGARAPDQPAEAEVVVTLTTSPQRYQHDVRMLSEIARGITLCRPSWVEAVDNRPSCPMVSER